MRLARQLAADVALDGTQLGAFFRGGEAGGVTASAGAGGAADAVHVVLDGLRQVVVDDAVDVGDVDAARRQIGRHQHAIAAAAEALQGLAPARPRAGVLERLPGMERDIAVVVPRALAAGAVAEVIREAGGPHLHEARLFDRYAGPPLDADELSLAWRLRFEPGEDHLDEGAIDAVVDAIVGMLHERLGARLRA